MRNRFLAILGLAVLVLPLDSASGMAKKRRRVKVPEPPPLTVDAALTGPVKFGLTELDRAITARGLDRQKLKIRTQVAVDPPESYRIAPDLITGGDLRGLMYGLLEAADQVRETGRLQKVEALPGMATRGARVVLEDFAGDIEWFHGREQWPALFRALAMHRFNRFQIAVPNLASLVSLPDFKEVATASGAEENLDALRFISGAAAEYGIDFTLGVWIRQTADRPYLYAALVKVLEACPAIRAVQLRLDSETMADALRAIEETGRRVTIEIPADATAPESAGLPVRFSIPYPSVTQPAKGSQFFWELPAPTTASVAELTRLVRRLADSGATGFEIDLPPAMFAKAPDLLPSCLMLGRLAYDVNEPK